MKMNKKIIAIVVLLICIICLGFFAFNKNKQQKNLSNANSSTSSKFKVKSAFADIDTDMVIQDTDPKDDDPNADYLFITFTNPVADTKKNDDSNPFNIKSYKLDGKALPDKSKILADKNYNYKIIVVLPNGYLKGVNANHSLEISKNLKDKSELNISGDLSLKLPYSKSDDITTNETASKNTKNNSSSNKASNSSGNSSNTSDINKPITAEEKAAIAKNNASMPKYKIELMKTIPMTTIVLVYLDTTTPEQYKVSISGVDLPLKTNKEGKKVFINSIDREYELDQVQELVKIEKATKK